MIESSLDEEKALWKKGYKYIAGIDEVGRGSWAGPLVVGAVILPTNFIIPTGFADSKHVKPAKRREFAAYIYERIKTYSIAEVPVAIINKLGIGKATHIGFRKAIRLLSTKPDYLLIDAFYIRHVNRKNQKAIKSFYFEVNVMKCLVGLFHHQLFLRDMKKYCLDLQIEF